MTFLNFTKTSFGLILLVLGLIIIFYSLYSSFNIFTAKAAPPEIFKAEPSAQGTVAGSIQAQIEEQLKGMLPVDSVPTLLNLISWSIFAGILIFAGAQIAGLGIKLIK